MSAVRRYTVALALAVMCSLAGSVTATSRAAAGSCGSSGYAYAGLADNYRAYGVAAKLTEWPGGGLVGIHGTNLPQLIGQAVSHGCIRVSNSTARGLERLVPVGASITIEDD